MWFIKWKCNNISAFNKNRSCIEMKLLNLKKRCRAKFNKNRSCIEMHETILYNHKAVLRLIKTEVVLKWREKIFSEATLTFNKNRSCIEIPFCLLQNLLVLV